MRLACPFFGKETIEVVWGQEAKKSMPSLIHQRNRAKKIAQVGTPFTWSIIVMS